MKTTAAVLLADPTIVRMYQMEVGDIGTLIDDFKGEIVRRNNAGVGTLCGIDRFWGKKDIQPGGEIGSRRVRLLQPGESVTITVSK